MDLFPELQKKYSKETLTVLEAQRKAHELTFGAICFQATRLMIKFGILQMLIDSKNGLTFDEIVEKTKLSEYACKCLLESSLTTGTTLYCDDKYICSKVGWFLLNDPLIKVDMDFNHHVNYLGFFNLEEALLNGKPEGLKVFGNWNTLYEGLSHFPDIVRDSWLNFDHYYSDNSFDEALEIVLVDNPKSILDVGGNTGRWALQCVNYNANVQVTIMDLPQQIELMKKFISGKNGENRILGHCCDLLNPQTVFPAGFEILWMSQFITCFSEKEIISILFRAAESMNNNTKLYIMEMFWDRQRFETAAFTLTQLSLYFTALANGNSKIYHSGDMIRCIREAGLTVVDIKDGIGKGHSILVCMKK